MSPEARGKLIKSFIAQVGEHEAKSIATNALKREAVVAVASANPAAPVVATVGTAANAALTAYDLFSTASDVAQIGMAMHSALESDRLSKKVSVKEYYGGMLTKDIF